jgi:fructan beta-fructosidase
MVQPVDLGPDMTKARCQARRDTIRTRGRVIGLIGILVFETLARLVAAPQAGSYDQPFRPQVHFSPQQHWTNDPNGLVYFRGEYHLFFQYNPFGDEWGHMSWGHAVSTDLLHWRELPVALREENGVAIFTGSVVVDRENSSGLCALKQECLVAIYTGSGDTPAGPRQNQNLAYSNDNGRTWTKYKGNPVLDLHLADFRDPSVSWDERQRHWLMAVSFPKEHKVRFYSSPNLKDWTPLSDFGPAGGESGVWECPDLLRVPAASGDGARWVLKVGLNPGAPQGGSGEQYFIGDFNGKSFSMSAKPGAHGWTNFGKDDYCAIGYNGLLNGQQPVLIGWMNNWQYADNLPTSPWRGQMSLARRLSIIEDSAGLALKQDPVITPLHISSAPENLYWREGGRPIDVKSEPLQLNLRFEANHEASFGIRIYSDDVHWTEIAFDREHGVFYIDRTKAALSVTPEFPSRTTAPIAPTRSYDVKLILDRSSIEAYAQSGTIAMTDLIFPPSQRHMIQFFSSSGHPVPVTAHLWYLHSIWK